MQSTLQDDDLVMNLVELALAQPPEDRERYLQSACAENSELFEEARKLVNWEQEMNGFLLDPLYPPLGQDQAFTPGELLDGRFRIVRAMAEGGMGVVYEAWDEKLERRIAIKAAKPGYRRRLPPEVRHASDISHPNICKTFEIHTASTSCGEVDFLTMEYIEGETLFSWLSRGRMPRDQVRTVALQLCAGLAEAHRNNIIHGDLKTGNVILTSSPDRTIRAVITDFGLAHRPDTTPQTIQSGAKGGTPAYMAPELWKGAKASVASDIYALGIILYELASGRHPLGPEVRWEERLKWKPEPVNSKWDRVLARCLDPDPARRFQGADEVAQALAPVSRRWLIGAAAAVVLAAVSGGITYYRVTAPKESVKLAVVPFETDGVDAQIAQSLLRDTAAQVGRVKRSRRFAFVRTAAGATHVLRTTLHRDGGHLKLHAQLTNIAANQDLKPWEAEYADVERRYIPVALAGLVTESFDLPPADVPSVNAAAFMDYKNGLDHVRYDTGIDEGLTLLTRAVAADPDSPLTHAALAEANWFKFYATKEQTWLDRAVVEEKEAERRNPDAAAVHRIGGLLIYNAGRYEEAIKEYQRAITLEPQNSDAYRRLGLAYQQSDQLAEALAAYRTAVAVEPGFDRNLTSLGGFLVRRANYSEASMYFAKAVQLAPTNPEQRYGLGLAYLNMGRYGEAESELRQAVSLKPNYGALNNLGLSQMYQAREQEAILYLEQAVQLAPGTSLPWMNLGLCYRRIGDLHKAEASFRRGVENTSAELARNPRSASARSTLAYLEACLGDRERALSEIVQALQTPPIRDDVLFDVVKTYEELGEREKTLALLSTCPDSVIADVSRWPYMGDLHRDARFQQLLLTHHTK